MAQIVYIDAQDFYIEKETMKVPLPAMHHHPSLELYYLVKGEREYFIDDQFFQLTEGDLVLIPSGVLHRTAGKGANRFLVYFSEEFWRRFFTPAATDHLFFNRPFVFRPDAALRERLLAFFNTLLGEFQKPDADDAVLAGYLYQILFLMHHEHNTYVPKAYSDARIGEIVKYINENYNQISDISEIAAHFFISKFHLCRTFNKSLGVPLITYLNTIKVREACLMMQDGKHTLTEIATKCGFNSASYFCKVFKGEKGISPTEYKKKLLSGSR